MNVNTQAPRLLAQLDALLQLEMPSMSHDMLCKLDQSVAGLSNQIKRSRNSAAPMNRIPLEILETILAIVIVPPSLWKDPECSPLSPNYPQVDSIKNLSRVCHRWYNIVRQNPTFYCDIIEHDASTWRYSAYPRLFLTRSGARPLRLLATFTPTLGPTTVDVLQNHMHRLRELHLHSNTFIGFEPLRKWLSQPAPILQCFTGGIPLDRERETPFQLFGDCSPCLEALALTSYDAGALPLHTFPNLAHIYLAGVECKLTTLTSFFRESPRLETIYLYDIRLHIDRLAQPQSDNPVGSYRLPRLRALVCDKTSIISMLFILAGMNMPPGLRAIHLATTPGTPQEEELFRLHPLPPLTSTLHAIGPFAKLTIGADFIDVRIIGHSCRFSLRCSDESKSNVNPTPWLDFIWAALPCVQIVTMRVVITSSITTLPAVFQRTPFVRKLILRVDWKTCYSVIDCDQFVVDSLSFLKSVDENSMPALEEIELHVDSQVQLQHIDKIMSLFAAFVHSRKNATAASALRVCRVNMCDVSPDAPELDALKEAIAEVEVMNRDMRLRSGDGDEDSKLSKVRNRWWDLSLLWRSHMRYHT